MFFDLSHEIWALAQLMPGEGIEDGAARIEKLLVENFSAPNSAITPCSKHHFYCLEDIVKCVKCGEVHFRTYVDTAQ